MPLSLKDSLVTHISDAGTTCINLRKLVVIMHELGHAVTIEELDILLRDAVRHNGTTPTPSEFVDYLTSDAHYDIGLCAQNNQPTVAGEAMVSQKPDASPNPHELVGSVASPAFPALNTLASGVEVINDITYYSAVVPHAKDIDPSVIDGERIKSIRAALDQAGIHGQRTVHLKGFSRGLVVDADFNMMVARLIDRLSAGRFEVLVWDGDNHSDDSFTRVLPDIRHALPALRMVAFLMEGERYERVSRLVGFHGSWAGKLPGLVCFLVDDQMRASQRYKHLGMIALRATSAKNVFLLGGGEAARLEFELMDSRDIAYVLFDVVRLQSGFEEHSDLLGVTGVQVELSADSPQPKQPLQRKRFFEPCDGIEPVTSAGRVDPRWEFGAFKQWASRTVCGARAVAFVKVGYLRHLGREGLTISRRQDLPPTALHCGPPPDWLGVYHLIAPWLTPGHADPDAVTLKSLLSVFDRPMWEGGPREGSDDDLLWWDFPCRCQVDKDGVLTAAEQALNMATDDGHLIFTCARVRAIVLPPPNNRLSSFYHKGWIVFAVALCASCQIIVNLDNANVKESLEPEHFAKVRSFLLDPSKAKFTVEADRHHVASLYQTAISTMVPVAQDSVGFRQFCHQCQLVWLKVAYVRWLAGRGGPFPRRQDLHDGGFVVGVPSGRKFVVSYPWASEYHPSPAGQKLVSVLISLLQAGASDDDVVFIDYCSLPQRAQPVQQTYFKNAAKGCSTQSDRTPAEQRFFSYAMWDMSRLYAFKECEVLVLPKVEDPSCFPGGVAAWGHTNHVPYINRGWCCGEYSVARFCGNIINCEDAAVRAVESARSWPTSVEEYAQLMNPNAEQSVRFTHKGDGLVVKYNFFKMCLGLS